MAADARLALPEHLCQFADRQLHRPQQREDAQAGAVGERAEYVEGEASCRIRYKDIFI